MRTTLTPEQRREALGSFIELPDDEYSVVDRSTLQNALECPWRAKAIQDGRCSTVGVMAEAGEEAHKAFGEVLHSWIDSRGAMSPADLRIDVELAVRNSRPDLQPEAVKAIQSSVWSWASLVHSIHPENILAFDGGQDIDRSGQLAIDFDDLRIRYTSELDFLYQGDCPDVGEEVDYKTGYRHHTTELIKDSFQFQSHAVLALEKYPQWKALRVRVFDTRFRNLSYGVYFPRERMHEWKVRIRGAVDAYRASQQDEPPTWPTVEKCGICPAASICPVADQQFIELSDTETFVRKMVAIDARLSAMQKIAAAWVDAHGREMVAGTAAFGRAKPPDKRKKPAGLYSISKEKANGDSDGN